MIANRVRIQRASTRLRVLLQIVFYSMPIATGLVWTFMNSLPIDIYSKILPHFVKTPLPASALLMGFLVIMIPTAIAMAGVWSLIKLFRLYEKGIIFQMANVQCFKRMSRLLIWWFFAGIVEKSLLSVALTLHNPPGQRMISLELSSNDLTILLLGGILAIIAWVMEEGRKLQEDQDLTV